MKARWRKRACSMAFGFLLSLAPGALLAAQAAEDMNGEMKFGAATGRQPEFQAYIFWAYGLACALIFLFTLWTIRQIRRVEGRVESLLKRLERAEGPGRGGV